MPNSSLRPGPFFLLLLGLGSITNPLLQGQESYPQHPDSIRQPGVPEGKVTQHRLTESEVYPGTERDYFVYVPAQYDGTTPAAVMVFQDGRNYVNPQGQWRVPTVFDNLIHRGEMPVTIGVFVNPGVVPGGDKAQDRFNRSFEYDTVSERYATFIIDELLSEVEKEYRLTKDPNQAAIAGSSSGAIAAFGVAWHRPDRFRRVFSTVGTYVGLRGGNEYPTLIRKTEPKPLRIFLQDGSNDLDIYGGSWWNANLTMLSALQWAGYEVNHVWGEGGHNGKHGAAILPDALRWLWKDADQPIEVTIADHPELSDRLVEGETWKPVSRGHGRIPCLATGPAGNVCFFDSKMNQVLQVREGAKKAEVLVDEIQNVTDLVFDLAGALYCAHGDNAKVTRVDEQGKRTLLDMGAACEQIIVVDDGIYFCAASDPSIRFRAADGTVEKAGEGPARPSGLTVTPDRRFLLVADAAGRYIWSFRIEKDGMLGHGQPYGYVHSPQDVIRTGMSAMAMTESGQPLIATSLGIQLLDQPGRVHVILSPPRRKSRLTDCAFGGNELKTLYVSQAGTVYRRKTQMEGDAAWQDAVVPPKPRL